MTVSLPLTVPEGFRQRFVEDGWRGIERYYGARTDLMMKWIDECGGIETLQVERKEHRRAQADAARVSVAGECGGNVGRAA
jgi:hypothetical protein